MLARRRILSGGALFVIGLLPFCSCTKVRHYDEEPGFVRDLEAVKAERLRTDMKAMIVSDSVEGTSTPVELPAWHAEAGRPLFPKAEANRALTLDDLYISALEHSHQIQVFSDLPLIRHTGVREAEGDFDIHAYVQAKYDHLNEPVGNTQISRTGGRFVEDEASLETGLRKKMITGAEVSLAERLGDKDSNADYFVPDRQATGTLTLRIIQPLLSGGGICYNSSVIHVARLDGEIADQEFLRQVESHLLEVARSYWSLYASRAIYSQYVHQAAAVEGILKELKARADADAFRHQILRAESALTSRRADLVRSEMAILNAQDRLHALVNEDVGWSGTEIIPTSPVSCLPLPTDASVAGSTALERRPEIVQAFLQLRAAAVRLGMNRNEVLPRLNLLLEGRMAGLKGGWGIGGSIDDQWRADEAGGSVGLILDIPLGNNTSGARLQRRELEIRQQFNQLRTTMDTILLEVRISVREVDTGWRDLQAKAEAAHAAGEVVSYMLARKDIEAMRSPASSYLEDLMAAQDRQSDEERAFAQAVAIYQVAQLNLLRAQGTLLQVAEVRSERSEEGGLPVIKLRKAPASAAPAAAPSGKGNDGGEEKKK